MPAKRGSRDMAVPDITEDAAERKRVLNVLAQRRYRKRKKDRLQSLQAQVEKQTKAMEGKKDSTAASQATLAEPMQPSSDGNLGPSEMLFDPAILDPLSNLGVAVPDMVSSPGFLSLLSTPHPSQPFEMPPFLGNTDALTYPPSSTAQFAECLDSTTENQHMFWATQPTISNTVNLSDELQTYESATFTFPDDHTLEIPSLKLLNAAMKVAVRLNVAHLLWDLTATSPFCRSQNQTRTSLALSPPSLTSTSSSASSPSASLHSPPPLPSSNQTEAFTLPPHLQPTPTQLLLPHHPMLDILPWPSTRDRLIQIFNLPPELRPESAQDPMSLMHFAQDMEDDSGEGIRVRGDNVFDIGAWEIGPVLFKRWWWAFDGGLVERCNQARRGRGQTRLVVELNS
ncbi:hypothetical protein BJX64DRAFT_285440 [Aspergillus heterothallicus]